LALRAIALGPTVQEVFLFSWADRQQTTLLPECLDDWGAILFARSMCSSMRWNEPDITRF